MHLRRLMIRGAHDGNALRHHLLIASLSVEVSGAHKAGLGGMGVDPAEDHQVLGDKVLSILVLVLSFARVTGTDLSWDDQVADEQSIIHIRSAQDTAHFEPAASISIGKVEESVAKSFGNENGSQALAILEFGNVTEGKTLFLSWRRAGRDLGWNRR